MILGYYFHRKKLCVKFDEKMGWATFWAIFSQNHLVALTPFRRALLTS
jgi:hypothetical protein